MALGVRSHTAAPLVSPRRPVDALDGPADVLIAWLILAGSVVAYAAWVVAPGIASMSFLPDLVFFNIAHLAAALLCLRARVHARSERRAWLLVAVALLVGAAANVSYSLAVALAQSQPAEVPLWIDGLYLTYYPLVGLAVVLVVREQLGRPGKLVWIDGALVGLGAGAVASALFFEPVVQTQQASLWRVLVDLAYPAADLGLLIVMFAMCGVVGLRAVPRLAWFGVALMLSLVADALFVVADLDDGYTAGRLLDLLWLFAIVALAIGARTRSTSRNSAAVRSDWRALVLPVTANLAAVLVLVCGYFDRLPVVAGLLAAGCATAAVARMALTALELRALPEALRQARTDGLAGLANRRCLEEWFAQILADPTRSTVRMLLLDLDGFKAVNDRAGHLVGDELLIRTAARLSSRVRVGDLPVRLGGDEFSVLLPDVTVSEAVLVARAIHAAIAIPMTIDGVVHRLRVSIGLSISTLECADLREVLRSADAALYRAKRDGSGIVVADELQNMLPARTR